MNCNPANQEVKNGVLEIPPVCAGVGKTGKGGQEAKATQKKNPEIQPILLEGAAIARTWWGKAWNLNLEKYADYSNRIGRGRSYVRHGAVLDLQIEPGQVRALVQGSSAKPYEVVITIKGIKNEIWQAMKATCAGRLDSLPEFLAGKFPKALGEVFTAQGRGLFPSPQEITFECSCPDWASMCKHVAATLYGIGARLDHDPSLFFTLRKVDMTDLVDQAIKDRSERLLEKAEKKGARVIADSDLAGVFGIVMEDTTDFQAGESARKSSRTSAARAPAKTTRKKTAVTGRIGKPTDKNPVKTAGSKKGAPPTPGQSLVKTPPNSSSDKRKRGKSTEADLILKVIRQSKKGVNVATIKQKTGIDEIKIRNVIFKAFREGAIRRVGRGIYLGVK